MPCMLSQVCPELKKNYHSINTILYKATQSKGVVQVLCAVTSIYVHLKKDITLKICCTIAVVSTVCPFQKLMLMVVDGAGGPLGRNIHVREGC